MGRFDKIYARSPVWAQHAAITAYGAYWHWLRFGPGFGRFVQEYTEREKYSREQWQAWQTARVTEVLRVAASHVPYYRDSWNAEEKAAAAAGRLDGLPLLEKNPVRSTPRAFLRQDHRGKPLVFHTSGSTGTPIASMWTAAEVRRSLAIREVRSCRWAGVSFRLPRATFSGRMIEPDPYSKGPFHRFNYVERQAYLSAFHLRRETAPAYVEALRQHSIQWMTGYAVSYYLLARFMVEDNIPAPPTLKAIITTSEKLTEPMREVMQRAYKCRVWEEYSTVENVLFASECEHGRLHVSPDAGVVEVLRPDGTHCDPEEPGEVVATCLMRDYQPMIRFRLGDMASWDPSECPCGRAMPVIKEVLGRTEDVVVGPDGRQMVRFHGIFVDQPHVREGQIVQEAIERIRVKVVVTEGYSEADRQDIVRRVQQRLSPDVEVIVEIVESIPRSAAGKFQAVVSLIKKNPRQQDPAQSAP